MAGKMLKLILSLTLCCMLLLACERMEKIDNENKIANKSEMSIKPIGEQSSDGKILYDAQEDISSCDICILESERVVKKDSNSYLMVSIEEFIDCYNANYYNDNGNDYIQPYSEWYSYIQDFGRHKGNMHYEFTADKKIWTLPTITAYTPKNETVIKELTVNFDDHSYTDKMYKQYEEMCFYTLKVFFPNMAEKKLTKLYKKLNKKAYENIFQKEQGFHSDNPPTDLYYRDGVGIYPYFAYGESVRMCIIPVTKNVIKSYKNKGVKIHKL